MNLTEWADAQGIHVQTAYRWYREGKLPVPAQKVGRLILVSPETAAQAARKADGAGLYARVSWHDQKPDLDGQVARLSAWAAKAGLPVVRVEAEVGSGMNGSRAKVRRLLANPAVTVVVAEHRDRLGRMNTELVEAALSAHGRRLVVLDDSEVTDDLVRDMVEVLTSFCARLYRPAVGAEPGVEGSRVRAAEHRPASSEAPDLRWCRVSALRTIAEPFVVAPPAGARVRTRLRVPDADAAVLREAGEHLGSLASADLAARCAEGRLDAEGRAGSRRVRKQALTAESSSRWAGALTRTSEDAYRLGYRNLLAERHSLLARIKRIETRSAVRRRAAGRPGTRPGPNVTPRPSVSRHFAPG